MADRSLSEQDMIDILEEIARDGGNAAARIAAIKTLREIDAAERVPDADDELYKDWKPRQKAV